MNLNLHIERLMLDGLPVAAGDAVRLRTALEAELTRLLADGSFAPGASLAEARLSGGDLQMRPAARADDLGRQIGRRIFSSLAATGHGAVPAASVNRRLCGVTTNQQNNKKGD